MLNKLFSIFLVSLLAFNFANAEEYLPVDNGLVSYHTSPRYRPSEEHPLRFVAYIFHPIGWLIREGFTRPVSYLMGSTEETKSIFGFREPADYRTPSCFSASNAIPDCRSIPPYNYELAPGEIGGFIRDDNAKMAKLAAQGKQMFPNVNFEFNSSKLNTLGQAKVLEISEIISKGGVVEVVLEGHTDSVGTDEYNNKLGMDRAESVRAELVKLGLSADSLSTVTFGKTRPLVDKDSDEARALNRRVEVHPGQ